MTVLVDESCPGGSYALSLNTIAQRLEDPDTVLYTDTVTLKVTTPSVEVEVVVEQELPYLKPTPKNLY